MKKLLILPALFLVAACNNSTAPTALKPASGLSQVTSESTRDVPMSFNTCSGESVSFIGTLTVRQNVNGGGQSTTIDYHGTGTGDITGANYVGRLKEVDRQSGNSSTFVLRLQVTGGGQKPFILEIFTHYALNPQGLPGASFERVNVACD